MLKPAFFRAAAKAFVEGEQSAEAIAGRCEAALGGTPPWVRPVVSLYLIRFRKRPRLIDAARFLRELDGEILQRWPDFDPSASFAGVSAPAPPMMPVDAARKWPLPPINTPGDLARWLRLAPEELDWFADRKGINGKSREPKFEHYHYRLLRKPSDGFRLIEAPKPWLRHLQRRILDGILGAIPAHPAVHGFTRRRSIVTFAEPHTDRGTVLRVDLADFFPSISRPRVQGFFRTLGYPEETADLLGALCTNWTPRRVWAGHTGPVAEYYTRPHLPQGAPTSPAIANLCAFRADCRLTGLAAAAGAVYTRYGDDLAFSGSFGSGANRFSAHASAILLEEGFQVNHRKTRVMRPGTRQQLAGLVVNGRVNVPRPDFDQLKAILTNCIRLGPQSQNRDGHPDFRAHLQGRISFVEMVNPEKGARLRTLFGQIEWR